MVGICSVGVGGRQSEEFFVCFGVRPTQRFPTRPEEDEEKQGPRAVNREELATVRER